MPATVTSRCTKMLPRRKSHQLSARWTPTLHGALVISANPRDRVPVLFGPRRHRSYLTPHGFSEKSRLAAIRRCDRAPSSSTDVSRPGTNRSLPFSSLGKGPVISPSLSGRLVARSYAERQAVLFIHDELSRCNHSSFCKRSQNFRSAGGRRASFGLSRFRLPALKPKSVRQAPSN
jgi:hypothetical protein